MMLPGCDTGSLSGKSSKYDLVDEKGNTPLMYAAMKGDNERIKFLINNGANVNLANRGYTPLSTSSAMGHTKTVRLLIENGANINTVSDDGITPLMQASINGHTKTARFLIENGANRSLRSPAGLTASDFAKMARGDNKIPAKKQESAQGQENSEGEAKGEFFGKLAGDVFKDYANSYVKEKLIK